MVWLPLLVLAALGTAQAFPAAADATCAQPAVSTVYSFPNRSWPENLAVRANGEILVTRTTSAELVLVSAQRPECAAVVYDFAAAGLSGLTGIAEYRPDVFAVLVGDYRFGVSVGAGSWTVFSVDMRGVLLSKAGCALAGGNLPRVRKVASVGEALYLNGLAPHGGLVLAADLFGGVIYRVDMATGAYGVAINSTYLAKLDTPHGVNGLRTVGSTLYFANSGQSTLVRVPIADDGSAAGDFSVIARNQGSVDDDWDDFAVDYEGAIFAVTGGGNTIVRVSPDGRTQTVVAGSLNSTQIAEPSSAQFGRTSRDSNILYVTTAGGLLFPINGSVVVPGALVAVETDSRGAVGLY